MKKPSVFLFTVILTIVLTACNATQPVTPTAAPTLTAPAEPTEGSQSQPTAAAIATATSQPTAPTNAAVFPNPENYQWVPYVSGFDQVIDLTHAKDGSGRMFGVEKAGLIRIIKDGKLISTPFLDIQDRVGNNSNERGLLGLAFHPKYKENGYFYVNYTGEDGTSFVSRFKVSADANLADPASEQKLLTVSQPYPNHNGGSVAFGADGYLYLGFGDGGSGGDPDGNGQSTNTLLGKILRLDVDSGDPYAIPQDNPFASGGGEPEIWAYGLRNPWRISFDSLTGDLYIADVGQNQWEEVDFLPAGSKGGANFGWDAMEGSHPFQGADSPSFVAPIAEYSHREGGCSISGGYVYRGVALPEWHGVYFYTDYCSGKIWGLHKENNIWKSELLFTTPFNSPSFGVDESGELYIIGSPQDIYRLEKK